MDPPIRPSAVTRGRGLVWAGPGLRGCRRAGPDEVPSRLLQLTLSAEKQSTPSTSHAPCSRNNSTHTSTSIYIVQCNTFNHTHTHSWELCSFRHTFSRYKMMTVVECTFILMRSCSTRRTASLIRDLYCDLSLGGRHNRDCDNRR